MQAIILAAGMGNRLRPLTEKVPKCMVEVNGTPIILNTLNILAKHNVKKVIIVVGHLANIVKKRVGKNWKGMQIVYVENKLFNKTNNIYSLWLARSHLNYDTILLECDIFFEEKLIQRIINKKFQNTIVVDYFKQGMDGTVVEIDKDNRVVRMIPARDQDNNFSFQDKFKTVNVYYFSKEFLLKYFVPNLKLYIKTQNIDQFYELILVILIYLRNPGLYATLIDGIKWIEVDDFSDLHRAEYLFLKPEERISVINRKHGGFWKYNFKDYSYLYNLYFPPLQFLNELRINFKNIIANYPSGQKELRSILSNWTGVEDKYLVVANGASEVIRIINKGLIRRVSIPIPTFNEYESGLTNDQINYFRLDQNSFKLNVDKYVKSVIESKSDTALLINPNNPTSQFTDIKGVHYLLKKLSQIKLFILDESFIDFVSQKEEVSLTRQFHRYKNLVIIKSMSKDLGVAGLRLGYAISVNIKLLERIRRELPIWNINSFAESFLESLPKYRKEYKDSCKKVISDRQYLYKELSKIDKLRPLPGKANFILCELKGKVKSDTLRDILLSEFNILIKDCSNKKGLENKRYIRIAARTKEDTDILSAAFKKVL